MWLFYQSQHNQLILIMNWLNIDEMVIASNSGTIIIKTRLFCRIVVYNAHFRDIMWYVFKNNNIVFKEIFNFTIKCTGHWIKCRLHTSSRFFSRSKCSRFVQVVQWCFFILLLLFSCVAKCAKSKLSLIIANWNVFNSIRFNEYGHISIVSMVLARNEILCLKRLAHAPQNTRPHNEFIPCRDTILG